MNANVSRKFVVVNCSTVSYVRLPSTYAMQSYRMAGLETDFVEYKTLHIVRPGKSERIKPPTKEVLALLSMGGAEELLRA